MAKAKSKQTEEVKEETVEEAPKKVVKEAPKKEATSVIDFLEKQRDVIKPYAKYAGLELYDAKSYKDLVEIQAQMKLNGSVDDVLSTTPNRSGSKLLDLNKKMAVSDPDKFVSNLFRVIEVDGEKKIQVVLDYQAIVDAPTGNIYRPFILAYQAAGVSRTEFKMEKTLQVSDEEFSKYFKKNMPFKEMTYFIDALKEYNKDHTIGQESAMAELGLA